ncbi:MAG: hypothetical protein ACRCXM_15775 [Beijerinckiaceae bacterium]
MATIQPTQGGAPPEPDSGLQRIIAWGPVAAGDTCAPADFAQFADRTVQVSGTFDGASVAIEGSIDGETWLPVTDPQGNAITASAAKLEAISEMTTFIRPVITGGGAGCAVKVAILVRRSR